MNLTRPKLIWALTGGILVASILVAGYMSGLADGGSAGEPPAAASESGGYDEGIQVHGDWVIEVRNEDGSLAERREFENALLIEGRRILANTLARQYFVGAWGIELVGSSGPCTFTVAGQDTVANCLVHEPVSGLNFTGVEKFATLSVTPGGIGTVDDGAVVLSGNFVASRDGGVSMVSTYHCFSLPPNSDPSTCNNTQAFTSTNLGAPVDVVAGQQVLVTVRISFS